MYESTLVLSNEIDQPDNLRYTYIDLSSTENIFSKEDETEGLVGTWKTACFESAFFHMTFGDEFETHFKDGDVAEYPSEENNYQEPTSEDSDDGESIDHHQCDDSEIYNEGVCEKKCISDSDCSPNSLCNSHDVCLSDCEDGRFARRCVRLVR